MIRKNTLAQVLIDNQVARVDYFFRNNQNKLFKLRAQKDIVLGWKTLYRNEDILESIVNENDDNTDINKVYKFYIENIYKADIKIERFIKNPCPKLYKESDIIKILEQKEIGRPSTYASYSSIVLNRNYAILNDKKQLMLTELGNKLADVCIANFKYFINYDFTKTFENELDKIAKNKTDYHAYLKQLDNEISLLVKDVLINNDSEHYCDKCKAYKKIFITKNNKKYYRCLSTKWNDKKKQWDGCEVVWEKE
ncbi:hypothetical protein CEG41_00720 [Ureaplasma parvum]|nr:hypothetical protein CEG41_00720 [Ureaplasma parvum]